MAREMRGPKKGGWYSAFPRKYLMLLMLRGKVGLLNSAFCAFLCAFLTLSLRLNVFALGFREHINSARGVIMPEWRVIVRTAKAI